MVTARPAATMRRALRSMEGGCSAMGNLAGMAEHPMLDQTTPGRNEAVAKRIDRAWW